MTSNDLIALGRPRAGRTRQALGTLIAALTLALAVLAVSAMPALAAATTSTSSTTTGYSQTPKPPAEKEPTPEKKAAEKEPAPEKEVAPEKEAAKKEVAPKEEEAAPTQATSPAAKATALPFTGLDLRILVAAGLLLIVAGGVSLRVLRRRERHGIGR
jgi:uncharacterized surface anchored protein